MSLCDKLHNARSVLSDYRVCGDAVWERFKGGKDGTLWYYRSLVQAFRHIETSPLLDEFERVVAELEQLVAQHSAISLQ